MCAAGRRWLEMLVESLNHTGPSSPKRLADAESLTMLAMTQLPSGLPIFDALHHAVHAAGADFGAVDCFGGFFTPLSYCIPADGNADRAVNFSSPRGCPQAGLLLSSGIVGQRQGKPFCHLHAIWQQADSQLRAGHVFPETIVGDPAPWAVVAAMSDVRWESCDDLETKMPAFAPSQQNGVAMQQTVAARAVVARVLPNEHLETAITELCERHGLRNAYLRGGSGSLIGAVFQDPDGTIRCADAPATEVVALVGLVRDGKPDQLHAVVVDKYGMVHAGALAPGENKVAVTLEIVLQEVGCVIASSTN